MPEASRRDWGGGSGALAGGACGWSCATLGRWPPVWASGPLRVDYGDQMGSVQALRQLGPWRSRNGLFGGLELPGSSQRAEEVRKVGSEQRRTPCLSPCHLRGALSGVPGSGPYSHSGFEGPGHLGPALRLGSGLWHQSQGGEGCFAPWHLLHFAATHCDQKLSSRARL